MAETKKVALVTGANKGIGFQIAKELGEAGCTVLVGARNAELGEAAAATLKGQGLDARFIALDVTATETIVAAAKWIETEFGKLDILVNNAGIAFMGIDGAVSTTPIDVVEKTLEVNFFGALRVTQAMMSLVKASGSGRIVNVSSGLGSITQNADPNWAYAMVKPIGYNASKAAMNMLTVHTAYELRDTKVKVNSADPGYTKTDLNHNSGHQTVEQGAEAAVRLALLPEDGPTGGYFEAAGPLPW